jgi:excinuclease ABC subunit C
MSKLGLDIPVFGMVKDEYHKTRALSSDEEDISIAREQAVFNFIYKLQEEVHRFTITKMSNSRSKAIKRSSLEDIEGIGPAKAKALLAHFKTISKIKEADISDISAVKGISNADAERIVGYFNNK